MSRPGLAFADEMSSFKLLIDEACCTESTFAPVAQSMMGAKSRATSTRDEPFDRVVIAFVLMIKDVPPMSSV
ncbi:MAG: hypothetical protein ACXWC3_22870, partial [Burkholderiales bacterium]